MCRNALLLSALIAAVLACNLSAREIVVGQQDVPSHPATESSTNVAFNVRRSDVRVFDVKINLAASVSNAVQVAFGRDADSDGILAPEETDLVLGWSTGRWFVEDVASDVRRFADVSVASDATVPRFLTLHVETDTSFVPRSVAFVDNEGACFSDVAAACPPWLCSSDWNLLRVTRRGILSSEEMCQIHSKYRSFGVIIR